ncbi:hypothetical protein GE09DRAFT_1115635, partial [Coniochaeta sp. 2T2.1]
MVVDNTNLSFEDAFSDTSTPKTSTIMSPKVAGKTPADGLPMEINIDRVDTVVADIPADPGNLTAEDEEIMVRFLFARAAFASKEWRVAGAREGETEKRFFLVKSVAAADEAAAKVFVEGNGPLNPNDPNTNTGGKWLRLFFAKMTNGEKDSLMDAAYEKLTAMGTGVGGPSATKDTDRPSRFGGDMVNEMSFSDSMQTLAYTPHSTQSHSSAQPGRTSWSTDSIVSLETSSYRPAHTSHGETPPAPAPEVYRDNDGDSSGVTWFKRYIASLSDGYDLIQVPSTREYDPAQDVPKTWRDKLTENLTKFFEPKPEEAKLRFKRQPVSIPSRKSLLTEQLFDSSSSSGSLDSKEKCRLNAALAARFGSSKQTSGMSIGSSVASPTTPSRTAQETEAKSETALVPWRLLRGKRHVEDGSLPYGWIVCCNCMGANHKAEFHCLTCGMHARCKNCLVAVPKWYADLLCEEQGD